MSRAEGLRMAALVFLLTSLLGAIAAFTVLSGPAQFPKGGTSVYCGSAWQVLYDEPPREGENPRDAWSQACQAAADEVWQRARTWAVVAGVSASAAGVSASAAVCVWWGRRRSTKREQKASMPPLRQEARG